MSGRWHNYCFINLLLVRLASILCGNRLVQTADDDTPAGTGMDETVIFQIDAYMGGCTFVLSVMKEYKVAFLKLAFAYFPAVLFLLVVGVCVSDACGRLSCKCCMSAPNSPLLLWYFLRYGRELLSSGKILYTDGDCLPWLCPCQVG